MVAMLPLSKIIRRADARQIEPAAVAALAESIAEIGLLNPIRCRVSGDGWEVVAGSHRLAACESIGLQEIEAIVYAADDVDAELAMIDENLCRAELSPADRAQQVARRKVLYEKKHPETRHGGDRKSDQVDNLSTRSFADETAVVTGRDARSVRRDAERGEKVIPEVIEMVRGTKLDTGTYLDKLKKMSANDQYQAAKRDLAISRQQQVAPRKVVIAADPLNDPEALEKQVARLMVAWNSASPEAREEFLSRVDAPVFDAAEGAPK